MAEEIHMNMIEIHSSSGHINGEHLFFNVGADPDPILKAMEEILSREDAEDMSIQDIADEMTSVSGSDVYTKDELLNEDTIIP
jgi:hypothetical protein